MAASYWDELSIAPTTDRALIRRAYAGRLKTIVPERDPDAFQRLRTAYESALREAVDPSAAPPAPKPVEPRLGPEPDPAADRARAAVMAAIDRGDAGGAYSAFDAAEDTGLLSLTDLEAIEERLLPATVADRGLAPERLLEIVRRFGWDNSIHPLRRTRAPAFAALDARLDAERWHRELLERARRARRFYEGDGRRAARQLSAGAPNWWRRYVFHHRSPWLGRELTALDRHREWVGDRFDPARIAWCRGQGLDRQSLRVPLLILFGASALVTSIRANNPLTFVLFVLMVLVIRFMQLARQGRFTRKR